MNDDLLFFDDDLNDLLFHSTVMMVREGGSGGSWAWQHYDTGTGGNRAGGPSIDDDERLVARVLGHEERERGCSCGVDEDFAIHALHVIGCAEKDVDRFIKEHIYE